MKITTFNPLIITRDPDTTIELFEQLGFVQHHVKDNISEIKTTDVRLKDANGFYVDVAQGDGEYTMIRVNVDNFDEAIAFFISPTPEVTAFRRLNLHFVVSLITFAREVFPQPGGPHKIMLDNLSAFIVRYNILSLPSICS